MLYLDDLPGIGFLFAQRERKHLPGMTRRTKRILKGAVAGLAGGLAGSFAMNEFQSWWSKINKSQSGNHSGPATVKAAETIAEKALHRRIPGQRKNLAGEIVHYAFGTLNGAVYGALAEREPRASAFGGTLFGAALFLVADETLVPMLGWSQPPNKYPLSSHVYGLASHLVYGTATNAVRGLVRAAL